jgi:RHS repeat-associated protein
MMYDALGRMVEENRSGACTQFVYSPTGFKMQVINDQAPPVKSLVPLPDGGVAIFTASGQYYYHPDHLGSSRFASTSNRTMYFDTAYAPFGEPYATSGTADPSFTGQRQDTVAGLYDFPAREYSIQGRWPSPDPAGLAAVDPSNPQSWNRYAYVFNNPLLLVDPTGLCGTAFTQTTTNGVIQVGPADDSPCPGLQPWLTITNFACLYFGTCLPGGAGSPNSGGGEGGSSGTGSSSNTSGASKACKNGTGSGGVSIGAGYNLDAGVGVAGVSSTGGVNAGLFHNKAGGLSSGYSGGAAAFGGVAAYAGSKVAGSPPQGNNVAFALGGYAGVGPNITFTNAASVQQTGGPFTTASFNAGLGIANLGVQISFGGGIWEFSITPPLVSAGVGLAGSVITTNTITTQTGCK